jgi:hypothetical protein
VRLGLGNAALEVGDESVYIDLAQSSGSGRQADQDTPMTENQIHEIKQIAHTFMRADYFEILKHKRARKIIPFKLLHLKRLIKYLFNF